MRFFKFLTKNGREELQKQREIEEMEQLKLRELDKIVYLLTKATNMLIENDGYDTIRIFIQYRTQGMSREESVEKLITDRLEVVTQSKEAKIALQHPKAQEALLYMSTTAEDISKRVAF